MRFLYILLFSFIFPACLSAQFIGVGTQYADAEGRGNALQFAANASFPTYHKKNALNLYLSSGIDYTGGSSPIAGLNIKPISLTTYFSEPFFNSNNYTLLLGCDGGYLFNFRHGKDGVVITPNLYFDYKCLFVKTGYDFNVTGGERQFFVRVGVSLGMGALKMLPNTKIR